MANSWSTREDVLKDLEYASGRRVLHHVEDRYLLYGEQPPPRQPLKEDDEMGLRFGSAAAQRLGDGTPGPDLIGITKMLRMVQQYETSSDEERPLTPNRKIIVKKGNLNKSPTEPTPATKLKSNSKSPSKKNVTCANPKKGVINDELTSHTGVIGDTGDLINPISRFTSNTSKRDSHIKVSKYAIENSTLNPNVEEFIPKSVKSSRNSQTNEDDFICASAAQSTASDDRYMKTNVKTDSDLGREISGNKDMKAQMAIMLKKQISTKNFSHQEQQQTHRAIVSLLKLYADPPKPLKLLTPDFFAKSKAIDSKIDTDQESNIIGHSLHRMVSLHNVDKADGDQTSKTSRKATAELDGTALRQLETSRITSENKDFDSNTTFKENIVENFMTYSDKNNDLENNMSYTDKSHDLENNMSENDTNNDYKNKISDNDTNDDLENNMSDNDTNDDLENNSSYNDKNDDLVNNLSCNDKNDDLENNLTYNDKNDDLENNVPYNDENDYLENNLPYNDMNDDLENNLSYNDMNDDLENNLSYNDMNDDLENNLSYKDKSYDLENNISFSDKSGAKYNKQDHINAEHFKTNEEEQTQPSPDINDIQGNGEIDPYILESIRKVTNWQNNKPVVTVQEKPKSPLLYLGAVGYKRKDPQTCKSPEIMGKKASKPTEFKPSTYADELHKKFKERSQTATPLPVMNMWEKLEADLKKKDLEIKNRKKKA